MMVFAIFIIMLLPFCVHARVVFKFYVLVIVLLLRSHELIQTETRSRTQSQRCETVLTLIDKVCNVLDFHQCWGRALFVQEEQSLQKLFPTNGASPLLPKEADSALRMIKEYDLNFLKIVYCCCWGYSAQMTAMTYKTYKASLPETLD